MRNKGKSAKSANKKDAKGKSTKIAYEKMPNGTNDGKEKNAKNKRAPKMARKNCQGQDHKRQQGKRSQG